jgi:hypothetical protein
VSVLHGDDHPGGGAQVAVDLEVTLFGVGGVFVIGAATSAIGMVLMAIWNLRSKAFFRGETLAPEYLEKHRPDLVQQVRGL